MNTLSELKNKNLEHLQRLLNFENIDKFDNDDAKYLNDLCDAYFKQFTPPPVSNKNDVSRFGSHMCIRCSAPINGNNSSLIITQEVEANCKYCNWPYRVRHNILDDEGDSILDAPLNFILPYHPDNVTEEMLNEE